MKRLLVCKDTGRTFELTDAEFRSTMKDFDHPGLKLRLETKRILTSFFDRRVKIVLFLRKEKLDAKVDSLIERL